MSFEIQKTDSKSDARVGSLQLKNGSVSTPAFMPVGTFGSVRGMSAWDLKETGAEIMLSNTYHLLCRPGRDVIQKLGGLHSFSSWGHPILTDSGGFQVFSLSQKLKIDDEGVLFQNPYDGSALSLTPEKVVEVQEGWGSDILMPLDHCPPADASPADLETAVKRTTAWAKRSQLSKRDEKLKMFSIIQGGSSLDLRRQSFESLRELEKDLPWDGYAIGGLSVGEEKEDFVKVLYEMRGWLPRDKPRYLMGVGTPRDLVFAVACGIDMFDCVIPSRNGRHGIVMTNEGRLNLLNEVHRESRLPIDSTCCCKVCQYYSRGFIRHLFRIKEGLGPRLATFHNVFYFVNLMKQIRASLEAGDFYAFCDSFLREPKHVLLGGEKAFDAYPRRFC